MTWARTPRKDRGLQRRVRLVSPSLRTALIFGANGQTAAFRPRSCCRAHGFAGTSSLARELDCPWLVGTDHRVPTATAKQAVNAMHLGVIGSVLLWVAVFGKPSVDAPQRSLVERVMSAEVAVRFFDQGRGRLRNLPVHCRRPRTVVCAAVRVCGTTLRMRHRSFGPTGMLGLSPPIRTGSPYGIHIRC